MHRATKTLLSQQIRNIKWHRPFCRCAVLRRSGNVIRSPLPDVVIPEMQFHERLWKNSAGFINHVAIECVETNKRYTYKQLQTYAAGFATSLRHKLGLSDGDRVAVMMPNCPEYPVVAIGTMQAGCVLTTINPMYKEFEATHQMTLTTPKVVVTTPGTYSTVLQGLQNAKTKAKIIIVDQPGQSVPDGTLRYSELAEKSNADYNLLAKIVRTQDDTAFVPFSSGTTGLPKGVELSYRAFLAGLEMLEVKSITHVQMADSTHQDVIPSILPFFHVYGFMIVMMAHLATGCKLITSTKFNPVTYFQMLKDYKATILYVVPPLVTLLSKHPDVTSEHLASLKNINCGAAPMSASDADPLIEKSNGKVKVSQGFGTTETLALTTATLVGSEIDYASCGVPLSNMELKFVDPKTGEDVPIGDEGELCIRGPSLMKGYYRNEEATKESITEDGFYKSGDLGYYKSGVGMYISDRIKELIKVKGMQVAPAELEGLLRSHPSVAEAAVIGIPHEISGETPKAFIIPKKGKKVTAEEIQDFVASHVAPYKKIREVQFVEDIPKTASGKILRRELKNMYA